MRITRATLLLTFVSICLFSGFWCDDEKESPSCSIPDHLQGTWFYTSWYVNGTSRVLAEYYSEEAVVTAEIRLWCTEKGTGEWEYQEKDFEYRNLLVKSGRAEVEQHVSADYHYSTLVLHRDGETERYYITLNGASLTLTRLYQDEEQGDSIEFGLSKGY